MRKLRISVWHQRNYEDFGSGYGVIGDYQTETDEETVHAGRKWERANTIYASNYGYRKQCRNKSIYKPAVKLPFEGKEYLAPHEYKAFLTQLFGENYMELPPVDQRVTRHPISKLDFGEERRYTCHE